MTEQLSSQHIVDLTPENFQQVLAEESQKRLVMIDFWADWCAPCKALTPVLEKLANEYDGQFLLAKVNADEQPEISAQFGVRSLPTVALFKNAQPLDGFAGAQPESEIRALLDKHLPKPWDLLHDQALALMEEGDYQSALAPAMEANNLSGARSDIALTLVDVLLHLNRLEEAGQLLGAIPLADQMDERFKSLKAKYELAEQASDTPEVKELTAKLKANPDNLDLKFSLAVQLNSVGKTAEAMDLLIEILRKDLGFNNNEARKTLVEMIQALGAGDPLAAKYQRKLYTLLY